VSASIGHDIPLAILHTIHAECGRGSGFAASRAVRATGDTVRPLKQNSGCGGAHSDPSCVSRRCPPPCRHPPHCPEAVHARPHERCHASIRGRGQDADGIPRPPRTPRRSSDAQTGRSGRSKHPPRRPHEPPRVTPTAAPPPPPPPPAERTRRTPTGATLAGTTRRATLASAAHVLWWPAHS